MQQFCILFTGISGFLGHHFIQAATGRCQIYGWYGNKLPLLPINKAAQVDIGNPRELAAVFEKQRPQYLIHAAAISSIAEAERDMQRSYRVNVLASAQLAALCAATGIPFVFCSTDMVFDGIKGNYSETSPVNPLNTYGHQKAMAETAVLQANPGALILRLPLLLGYVPGSAAGTIAGLIEGNSNAATIPLFTNEYRSVAWAADVAEIMLTALENNWQGVYHLGGTQPLSRYETGLLVKEYYRLNRLHIQAATHEQKGVKNRPGNATMDSKKAREQGYNPHTITQALEILTRS